MNILFYGSNLEECLNAASSELGVDVANINYKIAKKNSIFNKTMAIEVKFNNSIGKNTEAVNNNKEKHEMKQEIPKTNESGIFVQDGIIKIIDNDDDNSGKFTIRSCRGINLYINDVKCEKGLNYNVTCYDDIRYEAETSDYDRNLSIKVSDNGMEVYGQVFYKPQYTYKLKDREITNEMILKAEKIEGEKPEKFSVPDVVAEMKKINVKYGFIYENIIKLCQSETDEPVLIAKGANAKDDVPDEVKIFFKPEEKIQADDTNLNEKVDYKNVKAIANVNEGQVIAQRIPGSIGEDGIDIYGKNVKRKVARNKPIKAGKGCKLENGKIISTKQGRPTVQSGVFTVNTTYSVRNVNMKSGNINFAGDVEVGGSIHDGMEVICRGCLSVQKDITSAKAKANGSINVNKNIIDSLVIAGGYDAEKKIYLECLNSFHGELKALLGSMEKMILKAQGRRPGELMKILIENRYEEIPKMSLEIITYNLKLGIKNSEILDFIRNKIMGLNAYTIESINELYEFDNIINDEILYLGNECEIPVDVSAFYVQNSSIISTGSIYINGPGTYISSLRAFDTIEFKDVDSVVRGGILTTGKYMKLKNVGSEAGVITKLKVDEGGIIEAETMHHGTILYFGKRRRMLEQSGRKIKAYMNKEKQIVIDMLKLEY